MAWDEKSADGSEPCQTCDHLLFLGCKRGPGPECGAPGWDLYIPLVWTCDACGHRYREPPHAPTRNADAAAGAGPTYCEACCTKAGAAIAEYGLTLDRGGTESAWWAEDALGHLHFATDPLAALIGAGKMLAKAAYVITDVRLSDATDEQCTKALAHLGARVEVDFVGDEGDAEWDAVIVHSDGRQERIPLPEGVCTMYEYRARSYALREACVAVGATRVTEDGDSIIVIVTTPEPAKTADGGDAT